MKAIWKYPLPHPVTQIKMPATARVLHVGVQNDVPTMWVEVPQDEPSVVRTFLGVATGGFVEEGATYCGTAAGVADWMVFHIYERS